MQFMLNSITANGTIHTYIHTYRQQTPRCLYESVRLWYSHRDNSLFVRCEVLTEPQLRIQGFEELTPWFLVSSYRLFEESYWLQLPRKSVQEDLDCLTVKVNALRSAETSGNDRQMIHRQSPRTWILVYLITSSVVQITNRRTVWSVNDELKRIWKEAVVT